MAQSVHSVKVNNVSIPKFLFNEDKQIPKPQYKDLVKKLITEKGEGKNGNISAN